MSEPISNESFAQFKRIIQTATVLIDTAESNIKKAKGLLSNIDNLGATIGDLDAIAHDIKQSQHQTNPDTIQDDGSTGQVVYGQFDGYFMLGDDLKKYPVPLNYSSKSKLVPGDKLKLTLTTNGQLMYKLIAPCERRHIRAVLSKDDQDNTKYVAITAEGDTFSLNQAAVTFFRGHPGDEIYIITNKEASGRYAAIEAVIKN